MTHENRSQDPEELTRKSQSVSDGSSAPQSAPLVAALERAWQTIRDRHQDVPPAVLIVGSGTTSKSAAVTLGHFAAQRWQRADGEGATVHEVLIGGEGLKLGADEVLATLLHEGAHALALARGIKDTSRQGRYHNRKFKALAEELGLQIAEAPGIGWSATVLPAETAERYRGTLDDLADAITLHRRPEGQRGAPTPSRNAIAAVCGCGRRVRVAPTTLDAGAIVCALCASEFTRENPEGS